MSQNEPKPQKSSDLSDLMVKCEAAECSLQSDQCERHTGTGEQRRLLTQSAFLLFIVPLFSLDPIIVRLSFERVPEPIYH